MDGRERLIEIMKSQGLNSKQLSERIGVSAGTISNIMGGRNKPSLEFWQNVAEVFPHINHSWLFMGVGEMYVEGYVPEDHVVASIEPDLFSSLQPAKQVVRADQHASAALSATVSHAMGTSPRKVEKIMIFYSDGTFEER